MKEIKTLVLCSTRFAMASIQQLAHANLLCAVVVPAGADEVAENTQAILQGRSIPVIMLADDPENELIGIIEKYSINLCLMLTFSLKIPASVYMLPEFGFYNVHPSLLPLYRGPDPLFQQIRRKEEYTGITIHRVDENFDTGPLVMQEKMLIASEDTYGMLSSKLGIMASKMLAVLVKMFIMDIIPPSKQQNKAVATYYKRQTAADVTIKWDSMPADEITALINACNPWNKGAVTQLNHMIVRLPEAKKILFSADAAGQAPGSIISIAEHEMIIATLGNEAIAIPFISIEEGLISAGRFGSLGAVKGLRFG